MVISHSHSQPLLSHRTDNHNGCDLLSGVQGSSSDGSLQPIGDSALRIHSCDDMVLGCVRRGSGYVSFEDVMGSKEFREGSGRPPELAIRDPLVRTASRLYSRAAHPPRHRRRSPGPLGTRRGGAMHRFVKTYVTPCLSFVARAFGCMPGVAAH